mmetsp:Transcript_23572/g.41713  ORF Transcript_23572/g.41713 Transcript_23572/m.41713 type:complete len:84 (+) Transcript_23572:430-681(+)
MLNNITNAIDRGENLDHMDQQAEDLSNNARQFSKTSSALKRAMCCKNLKWAILFYGSIIIILIIIIVIAVCTSGGCKKEDENK